MADSPKNPIMGWWRTINCYPPEYNRAVHGPYDPRVNYAFKDTPLLQVKLGELPSWFMRRNYSPRAMGAAVTRYCYRVCENHFSSPRAKSNMMFTVLLLIAGVGYLSQIHTIGHHRRYKYHW